MSGAAHAAVTGAAAKSLRPGRNWAVAVLVGVPTLMRLNNAVRFPSLQGYDSFGHLTYIWHLLKTGQVPFADQGWSFFHPPLYYALAAAIWAPLHRVDPKQVLKLIAVVFSLLGLIPAWVSYRVGREYFSSRFQQGLAPVFVLFLPVMLYTAPMLGNEGLNAALCSLGIYALLRVLRQPGWRSAALLGVTLGLALLTKATAVAVAGAALATLLLATVCSGRWRQGIAQLAVAAALIMAICGWYYARNVSRFGTPFPMSREYFLVARFERLLPQGQRGPLAYLTFSPRIFVDPQYREPPIIDSVWTGAFAGTWFEVLGGDLMPPVSTDGRTRLVGHVLLVLGVLPTLIVLFGLATALRRLVRHGWDETIAAMLVPFAAMMAMFAVYTHRVPTFTAVKASYLLPVIVPFSFWFALGFQVLGRWRLLRNAALLECFGLAALIVPVFTYQLVFTANLSAFFFNGLGVLYYFAGRADSAQEIFAAVARGYHLYFAHENLAAIALDQGRPDEALGDLQRAAELLPDETFGETYDHPRQVQLVLAEYESTKAYAHQLRGATDLAITSARRAIELAPDIAEAHYNLAALLLQQGDGQEALAQSREACRLDPTFTEAQVLLASAAARVGDCATAQTRWRVAAGVSRPQRSYPWQTGRGDVLDAGLARRRIIDLCAAGIGPYAALRTCTAQLPPLTWLPASTCG